MFQYRLAHRGLQGFVCAVSLTALLCAVPQAAVANTTEYTLEVTVNWDKFGEVEVDPNLASYPEGTDVTLTAKPADGLDFLGWVGDLPDANSTDNPLILTMDEDKSIKAYFMPSEPIDPNRVRWRVQGGEWHNCGAAPAAAALFGGLLVCGVVSWRTRGRR
jgi:hypothetical protein